MKLYDLAGAEDDRRFSPYCWRVKLALCHKGLAAEEVPCRFTDKAAIAFSGQRLLPVLVDGDRHVSDSFAIARYLDEAYPERPSLLGGPVGMGLTLLVKHWVEQAIHPRIMPIILPELLEALHDKDKAYFRETREARFGKPLEEVAVTPAEGVAALGEALNPARATLATQPWLAGETPAMADYILFGAFMWARSVSRVALLAADDPLHAWRERLLDAFDGYARHAKGYEVH